MQCDLTAQRQTVSCEHALHGLVVAVGIDAQGDLARTASDGSRFRQQPRCQTSSAAVLVCRHAVNGNIGCRCIVGGLGQPRTALNDRISILTVKQYGAGRAFDNTSALYLNISGLNPAYITVRNYEEAVTA